jgi:hypothetical protein
MGSNINMDRTIKLMIVISKVKLDLDLVDPDLSLRLSIGSC